VEKAGSSLAVLRASANTWEDQETSRDAETGQVGRSAELALRHLNIIYIIHIYCNILNTYIDIFHVLFIHTHPPAGFQENCWIAMNLTGKQCRTLKMRDG